MKESLHISLTPGSEGFIGDIGIHLPGHWITNSQELELEATAATIVIFGVINFFVFFFVSHTYTCTPTYSFGFIFYATYTHGDMHAHTHRVLTFYIHTEV